MKCIDRPWPSFKIPFLICAIISINSIAWAESELPAYKQLSCSPETEKSPGALVKASFSVAKDDSGSRVVADVQSLMLVSNGERANADEHFFNSFWGEEKDGLITMEPNNDGTEQSKISKLEIIINEQTSEISRSRVVMKDKKIYAMNCKIQ